MPDMVIFKIFQMWNKLMLKFHTKIKEKFCYQWYNLLQKLHCKSNGNTVIQKTLISQVTYTIHDGQHSKHKSALYITVLGIHRRSLISLNSAVEPQKERKSQRKNIIEIQMHHQMKITILSSNRLLEQKSQTVEDQALYIM